MGLLEMSTGEIKVTNPGMKRNDDERESCGGQAALGPKGLRIKGVRQSKCVDALPDPPGPFFAVSCEFVQRRL